MKPGIVKFFFFVILYTAAIFPVVAEESSSTLQIVGMIIMSLVSATYAYVLLNIFFSIRRMS